MHSLVVILALAVITLRTQGQAALVTWDIQNAKLYPDSNPDEDGKIDTAEVHKDLERSGVNATCKAMSNRAAQDTEIRVSTDVESRFEKIEGADGVFVLKDPTFLDIGKYICILKDDKGEPEREIRVDGIYLKRKQREKSIRVVENKNAEIKCGFSGSPAVNVTWRVRKEGEEPVELEDLEDSERFRADGNELHISEVHVDDRAYYECVGTNAAGSVQHETLLRVRPKLAPLWPFLGIVIEVIVLALFIFLCERKRKSKEAKSAQDANGTDVAKVPETSGGARRRN